MSSVRIRDLFQIRLDVAFIVLPLHKKLNLRVKSVFSGVVAKLLLIEVLKGSTQLLKSLARMVFVAILTRGTKVLGV